MRQRRTAYRLARSGPEIIMPSESIPHKVPFGPYELPPGAVSATPCYATPRRRRLSENAHTTLNKSKTPANPVPNKSEGRARCAMVWHLAHTKYRGVPFRPYADRRGEHPTRWEPTAKIILFRQKLGQNKSKAGKGRTVWVIGDAIGGESTEAVAVVVAPPSGVL